MLLGKKKKIKLKLDTNLSILYGNLPPSSLQKNLKFTVQSKV